MSSPAEIQNQPSVEDLLMSIRQAIHGTDVGLGIANTGAQINGTYNSAANSAAKVSASMSQTRVNMQLDNGGSSGGRTAQDTENFFKLRNQLKEMGANAPHAAALQDNAASSGNLSRSQSPSGANGFAGILNGDTRLEDALEKLKRAGLGEDHIDPGHIDSDQAFRPGEFESSDTGFGEFEEDYGPEEFEDTHQYAPQPEPTVQIEKSFSELTRKNYLEPVTHVPAPFVTPAIIPKAREEPFNSPPLTSDQSTAETSAAFNRLADTIIGNATSGERSIDEITRELLRPMLQSWLDEHLPRVVERLVREEIERVARWGGK